MASSTDGTGTPGPTIPFGERLLAALKARSIPLGELDYATIQRLKQADREETIRALRDKQPLLSYAAIRMLREREPEELAEELARSRQDEAFLLLVVLGAMGA